MPRLDAASISIRSRADPLITSRHDSHLLQGSADERGRPAPRFPPYPLLLPALAGVGSPGRRGPRLSPLLPAPVSETPPLSDEFGPGKGDFPVRVPPTPPLSAPPPHLPRPRQNRRPSP